MPIFLISLLLFYFVLRRQRDGGASVALGAYLFYLTLIILEQIYLEVFFNRSFEFSDSSNYFYDVVDLSLSGIIDFIFGESTVSNKFYYVLNWIYAKTLFDSPAATGMLLKATNAIYFIMGYLLLRSRISVRFGVFDALVLAHPWLIYLITHNVRDAYIIFLLALFVSASPNPRSRYGRHIATYFPIVAMYFVRPFFVVPMLAMQVFSASERVVGVARVALLGGAAAAVIFVWSAYKEELLYTAVNGFLGNAVYFADEDVEEMGRLRDDVVGSGRGNSEFQELLVSKAATSFPVFAFTPHPYNWITKYIEQRVSGTYGIYTDPDSVLVFLGSIVNYLLVYPMLFKLVVKYRSADKRLLIFPAYIAVVYSVFLFGNADIRIRYTFLLLVVFAFYRSGLTIYRSRADFKYFLLSGCILLAIPFLSSGR